MNFLKIIVLFFLLISQVNANTIYNLIKIPNLEIYKNNSLNDIKYLTDICRPNLTTLLNVSEAHLETFVNMDNLVKTKEEIFSHPNTNHIILNLDDKYYNKWNNNCN